MVLDSSGVICCSKVIRRYIRGSIYQDVYTVVLVIRRYIHGSRVIRSYFRCSRVIRRYPVTSNKLSGLIQETTKLPIFNQPTNY